MDNREKSKKKVCKHGLNDVWINGADGNVRMCGWTNYFVGKLTENSIEEIWNGELAEEFRKSMLDGSYRFCNPSKCPYCANEKIGDMMVEYKVPQLPKMCNLSYQLQCNYVCKFCRNEHYIANECEEKKYAKIENEIKKMLPNLTKLAANGAGEIFCSPSIINLINENDFSEDCNIEIETNGSLFTPENWEKIKTIGNHHLKVYITVHSFDEYTYQFLSGTKLPVSNIVDNLKFVSELRKQNIINELTIATVICEKNFREMPSFVNKCLTEFEVDKIRLRFFEPYGVMPADVEWFYDIRNEYHPYHDEFVRVMGNPIFDNEKVWKWQGETKSLQKESPYILEKKWIHTIADFMLIEDAQDKIHKYLSQNKIKEIALYGWSDVGKICHSLLTTMGLSIYTIFDTYVKEKNEKYEIVQPNSSSVNDYDLIIITSEIFKFQIEENLNRCEYDGIIMSIGQFVEGLRNGE